LGRPPLFSRSAAQAAMAAAADWDWVAPAATAAALATSAAVWALTACWLALRRLAAWRQRGTRVASGFSPPDPPTGGRKRPYVAKGTSHGGARPGSGKAKGTSSLGAQRGLAKQEEPKSRKHNRNQQVPPDPRIHGVWRVFKVCWITVVWCHKPHPGKPHPEVPPGISCPKPQSCTTMSSLVAPISITLTGELGGPNQGGRHPPPFSVPVGEDVEAVESPADVETNS
jgi:hypothetical protein